MASTKDLEVDHEFLPFLRVYKNGKVERLLFTDEVPTSIDPQTGVSSKDVMINHQTCLSARLYLPKFIAQNHHQKLPLLIYFHGGCFCAGSAFSLTYHQFVNSLVAEANVVAVSVEYRLAPEHPVPIAYDDSWEAIQWVISHSKGVGTESWLRDHVDFGRVFLSGDSAGANISHNMGMRFGESNNLGADHHFKLLGIALIQPFFWGKERIGVEKLDPEKNVISERTWPYSCPSSTLGNDDPRINPVAVGAPSLSGLGCARVLVCVAEEDVLKDRGLLYYEALGKSGWNGEMEIMETKGKGHVFHLFDPTCEESVELMKNLASFLNQ
ncbi:Alpha/beta hydrolase fold-3 [Macleaya cordata]|uniref:Alpha/beta hydrolase fold-3 n=1 Tax=Macleaya cordata TaxID=56857 RepID=A0A200QZA7_MACCD|nr:Alpha/beta hydrolase fold-3 [Macleaya cordata]